MADIDDLLTERLLRVIDEGARVATYKLALLIALIEAVAESPGSDEIPTSLIAERVLELYYPQSRRFVAADGMARELRQITAKGSPVLREVLALRAAGDAHGCRTLAEARQRLPKETERTRRAIEDTFVRYPIPLLQRVGKADQPFLYAIDWPEGTGRSKLRSAGLDRIRLLPGVADRLVVLGPLLRPLIELHWARDVARWSGVATEDDALRTHLFGSDRVAVPTPLVAGLRELQDGCCFYCADKLTTRVEVDHFLAWSRWPTNAVENLVLADRCNNAKRDHLVVAEHLERWMGRLSRSGTDLGDLATTVRWTTDPARTEALVRSTYGHIAAGTPLWVRADQFTMASGPLIALAES